MRMQKGKDEDALVKASSINGNDLWPLITRSHLLAYSLVNEFTTVTCTTFMFQCTFCPFSLLKCYGLLDKVKDLSPFAEFCFPFYYFLLANFVGFFSVSTCFHTCVLIVKRIEKEKRKVFFTQR